MPELEILILSGGRLVADDTPENLTALFAEQNGIVGSTEIRIYGVEIDDHDAFAAVSRSEREVDGDVCLSAAVVAAYYDKSGFQKVFHWSASADNVAGQGAIHFHIKFHTGVRS